MTPLRRQMIEDMTARGFSQATHASYLHAVTELARFHRTSPDELTPREVQRFLVYLVEERGLAWATCNVYVHALRFFYRVTLERDDTSFHIPRGKEALRLPEILGRQEVRALLQAAENRRDRALLATTYGAGLRASEVIRLRLGDIDSERMYLRIEQGKRCKDRLALL
jgi:integrase/recombinase XerD